MLCLPHLFSYAFSEHSADELMTIYINPVNKWKANSASIYESCIMHVWNVFGELLSLHFEFVHRTCFPTNDFVKSSLYQIHVIFTLKCSHSCQVFQLSQFWGSLFILIFSFCLHKMHFFHHHTLQAALHQFIYHVPCPLPQFSVCLFVCLF